jgi:hypothetical protein
MQTIDTREVEIRDDGGRGARCGREMVEGVLAVGKRESLNIFDGGEGDFESGGPS